MAEPITEQSDQGGDATPVTERRRRGWLVWHGLRSLVLLVFLPVVFLIVAGFLLIGHEVTAPTWIKSRIEAEADKLLAGGGLSFGDIKVTVESDLHPVVRMNNATLTDADGRIIARVPQIAAVLSPRGLILRREILVQTVDLSGAQISIRRNGDGSVALAFDTDAAAVGQAPSFTELLDQIDQIFERPALEALEGVHATGLVVSYLDIRAGRSWTVDGGALSLDLQGGRTRLQGNVSLLSGRDFVTQARLDYHSPRGSRGAAIDLVVTDVLAADIASQSPALSWLSVIDAKMTAALSARLEPDGSLGPFSADLTIGAGRVSPQGGARPLPFQSAEVRLTYDPLTAKIDFDRLSAVTDWGGFTGSGQAELADFQNGLPAEIVSQLELTDIAVDPPGLYPAPLQLDHANLDTRMRLKPFSLDIGQFRVMRGDDVLTGQARFGADADGWRASVDLGSDLLPLDHLLAVWPETVLPASRVWVAANVDGGAVLGARAGVRISPNVAPVIAASWGWTAQSLRYLATLPPIDDGQGSAALQDGSLTIRVDQGHVVAPQGGEVHVGGTVFRIPKMGMRPTPAQINLVTSSTITAALSLLDLPPFGYMTKADLPVTLADGQVTAQGTINLPLKPPPLLPGDVTFDFSARLADLRSTQIVPDRTLTATALTLRANLTDGLSIEGPVRVGAVSAVGRWARTLGPGASPNSRVTAEVDLGPGFLDEFNIGLPNGTLRGSGPGALTIDLVPGQSPGFILTSSLQGIALALPAIGWSKSAGTRGTLEVEGRLSTPPEIARLRLEAAGLDALGTLSIARSGGLERAQFSRVRIGDWFDAPVTLTGRGANRPVALSLGGGVMDLRRATLGDSAGQGGPMTIALDRLQISEGIALTGFNGTFDAAGGFSGDFTAFLNEGTPVRGTVVPSGGRSAVRLRGDDAGGAFRSIGLIRNASGGSLDLTLLPTGQEGNYDGILAVTDLRVRDAPALAGLLDAISVVGLLQQMDGQGLSFANVDARFRITPDQLIVAQSSAVGPGLGISMDGTYSLASQQMDFQGVVSPLYLINGIGSILTRRGEGLIGFNYTLRGPVAQMRVGVNPLSVFTPGMFRDLFRRPPPQLSQ